MNEHHIKHIIKPGDLLFQLRTGGEREWIISRLFSGIGQQAINHVALYIGEEYVIEAVSPEIIKTPIDAFINQSAKDYKEQPCVTISRLKSFYQSLIPKAIAFLEQHLNQPYDDSYGKKSGWYCSQLILEAFRYANKGRYLFEKTPMSFKNPATGNFFPYWVEHYKKFKIPIPEGEKGSHPALMSLSDNLELVKIVGSLPFRSTLISLDSRHVLS
ncbi:MAG: YiiX/YebB-like N1pC/P60 family cysteine hydrolase [Endozoicomonas sp. (ex Botrylloides leachii)]|nr:YiiX/YebB-like N1pC/P60 family cysteine hydrolase [Endozoicomonas sp. (ex Botrylloides leachii)]